ncbi:hypothetical protein EC968_000910 [Mortierella alpina]|nr:hypothetical protein EC968_000910 [Mortierella alpina]
MQITAILSILAAATLVSARRFNELPESINTVPGGYIIEYQDGIRHSDAHNSLRTEKVDYEIRNEYSIFNGAAISVNSNHGGKDIAAIAGVKNVWPITPYFLPKGEKESMNFTNPDTVSLHTMTCVDIVHQKYKLTGKGIKVGVIDSGIDYKHPAFAAAGAEADASLATERIAAWPTPDSDPMDCKGHGTHVAGIVGADARNITVGPKPLQPFVGVAPEVTLGAYRISGCNGGVSTDVIMAAMEMAFNDGMDIINMSFGTGSSYKTDPVAVLGDKLVAHGMVLAVAAGNDGSDGVWMVADSSLGDLSSSVTSFDNLAGKYRSFYYAGVRHPYAPSKAWGKNIDLPASATLVPIFEKDGTLSDGCDETRYTGSDVKGKIILTLGDLVRCESGEAGDIALTAGAFATLVQSTPYGLFPLERSHPKLPMAAIVFRAGDDLLAAYKKNPMNSVTWNNNYSIEGGGSPSINSSFGLDGDLRSKPDIGAPGGNILSTYPLAKGGYTVMSGTSMATPYVAGSHALYMQAKHAKPRGDEIRKVFKNTATISTNYDSKTFTSIVKQGGGLINVLRAIETTSSITPDHIDLLDTNHFQKSVKITLKNNGKHAETYTLPHVPADGLNSYPKGNSFPLPTPVIEAVYATVTFSQGRVKIPAGTSVEITLRFTEPKAGKAAHFPIYSGYVVATPSSKGSVAVHVPYTGLKGDVSQVPK